VSKPGQAEIFLSQAELADDRSPLYAALWRTFAHDRVVAEIVGPSPGWDAPLRLMAGVHYLVLSGKAEWDAIDAALVDRRDFLTEWVAERGVQTNEVQRCWTLLPCFLEVVLQTGADAFDLVELGPAAGLNLVWDRYAYRYRQGSWNTTTTGLRVDGDERGQVPAHLLARRPLIQSRAGIDIDPIDVTTDDGALLLKSFVWGDQTARLHRLDQAIRALRDDPPELISGDAALVLPEILEGRRGSGALTVVWQTAVLSYLPADRRRLVHKALDEAGREEPLAFIEAGAPSTGSHANFGLTLQLWPGGEREELGIADHHGAWLDWIAS
jgi:hypothetical protein